MEYKCIVCMIIFQKGWSEEEADADNKEHFQGIDLLNHGMVCDDCYNAYIEPLVETWKISTLLTKH